VIKKRRDTYEEIRRSKGIFDKLLEGVPHGTSSAGVGRMTGTSKGTVATAWKARSNELLTAFRARDLSGI
jgi:hypothetical protein